MNRLKDLEPKFTYCHALHGAEQLQVQIDEEVLPQSFIHTYVMKNQKFAELMDDARAETETLQVPVAGLGTNLKNKKYTLSARACTL